MPVIRPRRNLQLDVRAHTQRVGGVTIYRYDVLSGGPSWIGMNEWVALTKMIDHHGLAPSAAREMLRGARDAVRKNGVWIG